MNPIVSKIIKSEQLCEEQLFTESGKNYTFLNPVSYLEARKYPDSFMEMDGIFADGKLLVSAIGRKYSVNITRRSFDMTSLATRLFKYAAENSQSLYFVGGTESDIRIATARIRKEYSGMFIAGCHHGYFNEGKSSEIIEDIAIKKPRYVIVGMGVCRQEKFLLKLKAAGFKGTGFTCGGFISQLAKYGIKYYPDWVNQMNIRFLYRFVRETHTRKRYIKTLLMFRQLTNEI